MPTRDSTMACALVPNLKMYGLPLTSNAISPLTGFAILELLSFLWRCRRANRNRSRAADLQRVSRGHAVVNRRRCFLPLHIRQEVPQRIVRPLESPHAPRAGIAQCHQGNLDCATRNAIDHERCLARFNQALNIFAGPIWRREVSRIDVICRLTWRCDFDDFRHLSEYTRRRSIGIVNLGGIADHRIGSHLPFSFYCFICASNLACFLAMRATAFSISSFSTSRIISTEVDLNWSNAGRMNGFGG